MDYQAFSTTSITEQETKSLSGVIFQAYLKFHNLTLLNVALVSGVRYASVWNIAHNIPVQAVHAALYEPACSD